MTTQHSNAAMLSIAAQTMGVKSHKDGLPVDASVLGAALAFHQADIRTFDANSRRGKMVNVCMYPFTFSYIDGEEWNAGYFMAEVLDLVIELHFSESVIEFEVTDWAAVMNAFDTVTSAFANMAKIAAA